MQLDLKTAKEFYEDNLFFAGKRVALNGTEYLIKRIVPPCQSAESARGNMSFTVLAELDENNVQDTKFVELDIVAESLGIPLPF